MRKEHNAMSDEEILSDRLTSHQIFQRVIVDADEEISRDKKELFFSSLAAGFAITLTFLLYVQVYNTVGGDSITRALLYPLGFVFIILGNYQLFTENTLPPVALILERMASLPALLVMWSLVLFGNILGVTLGALTIAYGGIFSPSAVETAISLGQEGIQTGFITTFIKAVFAGLVVAGVVWLDFSFRDSISRLVLIYIAFLAIPLGGLYHIVVSTAEVVFLLAIGEATFINSLINFLLPVLLGNIFGGVILVTVVNYFQTSDYIQSDSSIRLGLREWLFTYDDGRSLEELEELKEEGRLWE